MSDDLALAALSSLAGSQASQVASVTNLFNPYDPDCSYGYYVASGLGTLLANVAFNTTGYIRVFKGLPYNRIFQPLDSSQAQTVRQGQVAYFDNNKVFISGDTGSATNTFIPPADGYIRLSVPVANWWDFQFYQVAIAGNFWTPPLQQDVREWPSHFQIGTLRQTRMRAANLLMQTVPSQQLIINMIGDSYWQIGPRVTTPLATYLVSRLGDAGGGYVGFGFNPPSAGTPPWTAGNQPGNLNGNARPSLYPCRLYGNPTGTYFTANLCDSASATLLASGDAIEVGLPASPVVSALMLHFVASAAGSIRYGFVASAGTALTTSTTLSVAGTAGTTTVVALSLANMTQTGILRIEWVSGTAQLGGVDVQSAAGGVRVNKLGAAGIAMTNWNQLNIVQFQTSFAALGGHLSIPEDGRNSQAAGASPINRDNQYRDFISRLRGKTSTSSLGTMAMDILMYTPPENVAAGSTIAIAQYARWDRRRAVQARCAHIDGQVTFGYSGFPTEYASAGDVPLLNADGIHPGQNTGGTLIVADLVKAILPF